MVKKKKGKQNIDIKLLKSQFKKKVLMVMAKLRDRCIYCITQ